LSHGVKLSCNMGQLIPFVCEEVLPGDTWKMSTESLVRFAPLVAPIMANVQVYTHFFFVPNRLIWDNWEKFITSAPNAQDIPVHPYVEFSSPQSIGSLVDYLGLPTGVSNIGKINSLPFRAYQLIYNEYYRDQNVEDELKIPRGDGSDDASEVWSVIGTLRNRCWKKDYFTSALPFVQRGPEATLPLGGDAPVTVHPSGTLVLKQNLGINNLSQPLVAASARGEGGVSIKDGFYSPGTTDDQASTYYAGLRGTADLSEASAVSINELRRANALQKWLEISARVGARYKEQLLGFFGVVSKDARLQRPEYLGGGVSPVVVSEVLQTSSTSENSPQANMAGHAISAGTTYQFKKYFTEHGYLIGIMSVIPDATYQQGIPKRFLHLDNMDYAFPQFAHLGEQPILYKEIYVGEGDGNGVFGYTPRYAEYKYEPSRVHGDFRTTLNFWHLGRIFANRPALNSDFMHVNPADLERIFAVNDKGETQKLWIQMYNHCYAKRVLPKYGTPQLI
jgi:hypothetical protein